METVEHYKFAMSHTFILDGTCSVAGMAVAYDAVPYKTQNRGLSVPQISYRTPTNNIVIISSSHSNNYYLRCGYNDNIMGTQTDERSYNRPSAEECVHNK